MLSTRRTFVKHATAATAGLLGMPLLSGRRLDLRFSTDTLLNRTAPWLMAPDVKALALRALDVAKSAGAKYADVRILQARSLELLISIGTLGVDNSEIEGFTPAVGTGATFGVRAVVGDTWGFAGGSRLTLDGIERVARMAVVLARESRRRTPRAWEYAAAPVVADGHWEAPIVTDPFSIPIAEYLQRYNDGIRAVKRPKELWLSGLASWEKCDRTFASTEGSIITQRTYMASPGIGAWTQRPGTLYQVGKGVDVPVGAYGYETLAALDLATELPRAAEETLRLAKEPFKNAEVGQYPIVFGAAAMAGMLLPTARALELDRALGEKVNETGTTFAMPPEDILGRYKLGNPLITITGDRSRPRALGTIGWDEEGVKPDDFPLVQDGVVVDYITSRSYAPHLASWYQQHNKPVRSHGCTGRTGGRQPILQLPNLTLQPGKSSTTLDDLIKDIKRGYYVPSGVPSPDQQQLNMEMEAGDAYEIVNGKLGAAVVDLALQFTLPRFWQNVTALGGTAAGELSHIGVDLPGIEFLKSVGAYAVPALVPNVNVMNIGRQA